MTTVAESASCSLCAWSYTGADIDEQVRIHRLIHPRGIVDGAQAGRQAGRQDDPEVRVSAHELTQIRVCEFAGCTEEADVGSFCFFHARGQGPAPEKLEALAERVVGNGTEPVPAHTDAVAALSPRPKTKPWTREEAIEAVKAFHAREGRVPAWDDLGSANGLPGVTVTTKLGPLSALILAAGLEPNTKTTRIARSGPAKSAVPQRPANPTTGRAGKRSGAERVGARVPESGRGAAAAPPKSAPDTLSLVELAHAVEDAIDARITAEAALEAADLALTAARDRLREAIDLPLAGTPA